MTIRTGRGIRRQRENGKNGYSRIQQCQDYECPHCHWIFTNNEIKPHTCCNCLRYVEADEWLTKLTGQRVTV